MLSNLSLPRNTLRAGWFALVLLAGFSPPTHADDWMFRRSYFSHLPANGQAPNYPVPESLSAYRTAYYRNGFGVSTGYRLNNYMIQNGPRVDHTFYREGWIEFYPQGAE